MIMLHCAQLAIYCAVPRIVIKRLWEVVMLNCAPIIVTIYSDNQNILLYSSVLAPLRSLRNPPLPNRCLSRCRVCTLLRGTLGGPGKFPWPNYTGLYYIIVAALCSFDLYADSLPYVSSWSRIALVCIPNSFGTAVP